MKGVANNNNEADLRYGMSKAFFRELFLPKEKIFQNDIFEVTIEQNQFICYPYYFPDDEAQVENKGKGRKNSIAVAKPKTEKFNRE